ncbi:MULTISPECIES: HAD domain-containing protein [unclassified Variovorax]|uniref:HAD domain-containing protein n=1 Tax=unclassified Variovorax TaxID=663243 RepID=UPI00076DCBF9|nr:MULTISPECIES: HAD domain-containing protein [unclassified Variovorax]KWT97705.1 hypothetical protein APY03_1257 [Variovorax sp. WDL1]PNG48806.1 hypothetical protein CHC06_06547 [Variovorax sp. B2]PNG49313.1 hypothetical protein CHC07_06195 [Variovorax sp. B4]VTV18405.1 hypothetical protein WDL1P2_00129 [Variovorax sp. WDL1]
MILFLDFDGVLHPEGEGHLPNDGTDFCFLPRLEALLREFPHVRIVISSMWRERLSLDELREFFSPDIGPRIIGATPLPKRDNAGYVHARREGEICEWLAANGGVEQPWVALDDAEWQFDRHVNRLVACGSFVGFDDDATQALRAHLDASRL